MKGPTSSLLARAGAWSSRGLQPCDAPAAGRLLLWRHATGSVRRTSALAMFMVVHGDALMLAVAASVRLGPGACRLLMSLPESRSSQTITARPPRGARDPPLWTAIFMLMWRLKPRRKDRSGAAGSGALRPRAINHPATGRRPFGSWLRAPACRSHKPRQIEDQLSRLT